MQYAKDTTHGIQELPSAGIRRSSGCGWLSHLWAVVADQGGGLVWATPAVASRDGVDFVSRSAVASDGKRGCRC